MHSLGKVGPSFSFFLKPFLLFLLLTLNTKCFLGSLSILGNPFHFISDIDTINQIKTICHDRATKQTKSTQSLDKIFFKQSPIQVLYNLEVMIIVVKFCRYSDSVSIFNT